MKVLVCGGRLYANKKKVDAALDELHKEDGIEKIVHNAAAGAPTLAAEWARRYKVPSTAYPINSKRFGKPAGFVRDLEMLITEKPDLVLAFPGDELMVALARHHLVKVTEVK